MKPAKDVNFLSNINIANITDSFNIDVGDVLSGNSLLNNTSVLSGILSNNSILEGGILNGNNVEISPTIDLGLVGDVGDILPVNVLSNNLASPVELVGDVLSNNGDISVLSDLADLDVGGITTVVTDAVDVLPNLNVEDGLVNVLTDALNVDASGNTLTGLVSTVQDLDILTEPTAVVGDVLNATAVLDDVLNPTTVIGDVLSPTTAVSDVLDAPVVANVANVVAPVTTALDADFLSTDVAGDVLSNITSVLDTDIGDVGNIVGTATNLLDADLTGNLLNNVTSAVGADIVGAVSGLDVSDITGNILSNLTGNLGLGQLGPGIDLGDVGALIGTNAVTEIPSITGINSLVDQIDLFGVLDADVA